MDGLSIMVLCGKYATPRIQLNRSYWRFSIGVVALWVFFRDMERVMAEWQTEIKEHRKQYE